MIRIPRLPAAVSWTLALLLVHAPWAPAAHAQDRLVRRFAGEDGLDVPPVRAIEQDPAGFLWIGAAGGLVRYDGVEFRRWAPDAIDDAVHRVAVAPDGRIAAQAADGTIFRVTTEGAERLPAPPEGYPARHTTLTFDDVGRLWTVGADGRPAYRDGGAWGVVSLESLDGERARLVRRGADGGVYILTDSGMWRVEAPGSTPRKRFDAVLIDLVSLPDGRLIVLTLDSRVLELAGGAVRELASRAAGHVPVARPIAIAVRNGTVWAAFDRYLLSVRPGRPPQLIGPSDGFEAGGPLLVDHEGSLWLGSFAALFQYPEPEATLWNDGHGLPSRHTRRLARSGDDLWVSTWQGAGLVSDVDSGPLTATSLGLGGVQSQPCVDAGGTVWLAAHTGILRVRGERVIDRLPPHAAFNACAAAPGTGMWVATNRGLIYADARQRTLQPVGASAFGGDVLVTAVLQDRRGRLWAGGHERICQAPADAVLAGGAADWRCQTIPGAGAVTALIELSDGRIWAGTRQAAVLEHGADGWRSVPGVERLATRDVFDLAPSPSGGIWIAGQGILLRVRPRPDGWEVLERPGAWHGLPSVGGGDLIEDDDGTLWIATALGLLRVPPRARFAPVEPPRVALVDARVDSEPVPLEHGLELPSDRNRLELRFAALSYRDPSRIRYQVRLGPDGAWVDTRGEASFRWVDLPAGRYRASVRASLDGRQWSAVPAGFTFRVLSPWYRTPWALGAFALLGVALLWAAYRARVAFLLRLERQRVQIAMDLHDEMGSGLGSIGILADLLGGGRLDAADRRRIAREVAGTAEELGNALSDIVWSLDPRTATLEELASRLVGHGERLFSGHGTEFGMLPPTTWPAVRLPLALRRNILMIGLEALHNAARHARARRVVLTIGPHGADWELVVADDGVGLGDGAPTGDRRGRGMPGMRRRAAAIGAMIEWRAGPDGDGTVVALRFRLRRPSRRRMHAFVERLRRRGPLTGRRRPPDA